MMAFAVWRMTASRKDTAPAGRPPDALLGAGIALFVILVLAAGWRVADDHRLAGAGLPLALALGTLALHFVPVAALASPAVIERLRRILDGHPIRIFVVAFFLFAPYLMYWAIPGNPYRTGILWLLAWLALPTCLATFWPRDSLRFAGDALVILAIWLPFEFRAMRSAYPWPPGGSGALLAVPLGLGLLVYLTVVVRRIDGVGYEARLEWRDVRIAVGAFALFALVGIPIGLWTGFLKPAHSWPGTASAAVRAVMIFSFTAVPEETCFRGLVQGLLQRVTGRPGAALVMASLIFGLAHLDNGPFPDWRYALLATLAGLAYGLAFQKTGRLVAPALTHLLVDLTWSLAFKG